MKISSITIISALLAVLTLSAISITSCKQASARAKRDGISVGYLSPVATKADTVKRGQYLVTVLGCNDCHSAKSFGPQGPMIDAATMLGGYPASRPIPKVAKNVGPWVMFAPDLTAAVGPWGMSFAANISSDATGIGNWTEAQFFKALREGKYKGLDGTRPLLPPMPWQGYRNLTDDDIHSIFAYLKTTKPVHNVVPQPIAPDKL